jgi:dUTP pyrophosphatase
MSSNIKVVLCSGTAKVPEKQYPFSGGFDLFSDEDVVIPASTCKDGNVNVGHALVCTNIMIELPKNTIGRIGSRSGLSINSNIEVGAGWIDEDYRGIVYAELKNFSNKPFHIAKASRIAQLFVFKLAANKCTLVKELSKSIRDNKGFGSAG